MKGLAEISSDLGQPTRGCCHSPVTTAICCPGDSCSGKENPVTISEALSLGALPADTTTRGPCSEPLAKSPSIPATAAKLAFRKARVKGTVAEGSGIRAGKESRQEGGRRGPQNVESKTVCIHFLADGLGRTCVSQVPPMLNKHHVPHPSALTLLSKCRGAKRLFSEAKCQWTGVSGGVTHCHISGRGDGGPTSKTGFRLSL